MVMITGGSSIRYCLYKIKKLKGTKKRVLYIKEFFHEVFVICLMRVCLWSSKGFSTKSKIRFKSSIWSYFSKRYLTEFLIFSFMYPEINTVFTDDDIIKSEEKWIGYYYGEFKIFFSEAELNAILMLIILKRLAR